MKRLLMTVLVGLVISGSAWGIGEDGIFKHYSQPSCGEYLGAYAGATLKNDGDYEGNHEVWKVFGWLSGYLTAYNTHVDNGKADILGSMTLNDARRWIGSWCRDNPSKNLHQALFAMFLTLQ